jgi:hypothetical protein
VSAPCMIGLAKNESGTPDGVSADYMRAGHARAEFTITWGQTPVNVNFSRLAGV